MNKVDAVVTPPMLISMAQARRLREVFEITWMEVHRCRNPVLLAMSIERNQKFTTRLACAAIFGIVFFLAVGIACEKSEKFFGFTLSGWFAGGAAALVLVSFAAFILSFMARHVYTDSETEVVQKFCKALTSFYELSGEKLVNIDSFLDQKIERLREIAFAIMVDHAKQVRIAQNKAAKQLKILEHDFGLEGRDHQEAAEGELAVALSKTAFNHSFGILRSVGLVSGDYSPFYREANVQLKLESRDAA